MSAHVERHPLQADAEVRSVIEVKAAQEVLVRLSAARVLGDHHPRDRLQDLPAPHEWPRHEVTRGSPPLGGAVSDAEQVIRLPINDDFLQLHRSRGRGRGLSDQLSGESQTEEEKET